MNTKTIDERIREKARNVLSAELKAAFQPVKALAYYRMSQHSGFVRKDENNVRPVVWSEILDALEGELFRLHQERRESDAVSKFLEEVESLRGRVEELESVAT